MDVSDDGSDIVIPVKNGAIGTAGSTGGFYINIIEIIYAAEELMSKSTMLKSYAEQIRIIPECHKLQKPISRIKGEVLKEAESCKKIG